MEATEYELYSPDAYLDDEKVRETRHEYLGGTVHAMSGASRRHNRIAGEIYKRLSNQLGKGPCEVYIEGVKVHIKTAISEFFYYPDVMVGCDPEDKNDYYLENPSIIFEVISESTEQIDRREKLLAYQTISSLEHYVIVSQTEARIECLSRKDNVWEARVLTSPSDEIEFPGQGMKLALSEIFAGIDFEQD